jgi:Xaa-Pro aminopeptidase
MRKPLENLKIYAERRTKLAQMIPGATLIVAAPEETIRNGSVHNSFRQDSNLYYLTGFEEPGSIFVFRPGQNPETILFVRKKDAERETWDGFRFGPEEAASQFRMDKTYVVEDFSKEIVGLLKGSEKLYFRFYKNSIMDEMVKQALLDLKSSQGRTGYGLLPVYDADELIGEVRVVKSEADLHSHRLACELSADAHIETMKYTQPGLTERELHGYFIYQIMKRGAAREGYGGIFASGANACTLHYVFNDQKLQSGDLLLVDAAGEYNYFTSDITRTYPINGKFTEAQAQVYEGVLGIQKAIIEAVKPGVFFKDLHDMGSSLLTDLMLELGLLSGRKEDIIKANQHRKYYPHGIGHFLGMDVHDAGLYFTKKGESRAIESGMVFTVEPGLYVPANDKDAAAEYRGIGVRIEDNILVTQTGFEILTRKCPKEINDLERTVGKFS